MQPLQVCRICLVGNTKLYNIHENNIQRLYEEITGLCISTNDYLPQNVCWECYHRIFTHSQFKQKALRANSLMMKLLLTYSCLTNSSLKSIDRNSNQLSSTLTYKTFNVIHLHDTSATISEKDIKIDNCSKFQEDTLQLDAEVKNEDDNLEFDAIDIENKSDSSDEVLVKHELETPKIDKIGKPAYIVLNKELISITDLSHEEQISEIQKRKESSNYIRSDYRCDMCFKGFMDESTFKGHMIRHSIQSGTFECEICKVRFQKKRLLNKHTNLHVQKFSCRQCAFVTTTKRAAKLHEDYHNGMLYQCPHCLEKFGKFTTYMGHVRIKHPSDFICELCGYSFVSGKGLSLHKKLKHRFQDELVPSDGPYCERCEVRFASEEALDIHLKLSAKHSHDVRQKNDKEDISKMQKRDYSKRHYNKYKAEGPIPCEQCDAELPDSLTYYRHFRRCHSDKNRTKYPSKEKKYMCERCGKMFQSIAILQDHNYTHSDVKQFQCDQCPKTFQRQNGLVVHQRLHGSPRQTHACALCSKRFSSTGNLQRHAVSHTGLKPFKCEMCGKCFKHAAEKKVHITYVHLKKPWPKRSRGKRRSDGRQALPATESDILQNS